MTKKEIGIIIIFGTIMVVGFFLSEKISPAFVDHKNEPSKINWVNPSNSIDEEDYYSAAYLVYDDAPSTRTKTYTYFDNTWCPFLELTQEPKVSSAIRYYHPPGISIYYDKIDIDVFYNSEWHDVYEGSLETEWVEKSLPEGSQIVEKARIRQHTLGNRRCYLYEFDFGQVKKVALFSPDLETAFEQQTASISNTLSGYLQQLIGR